MAANNPCIDHIILTDALPSAHQPARVLLVAKQAQHSIIKRNQTLATSIARKKCSCSYAIDDEAAIVVVERTVGVVSEGIGSCLRLLTEG